MAICNFDMLCIFQPLIYKHVIIIIIIVIAIMYIQYKKVFSFILYGDCATVGNKALLGGLI